jgi:IPT/TIG domain
VEKQTPSSWCLVLSTICLAACNAPLGDSPERGVRSQAQVIAHGDGVFSTRNCDWEPAPGKIRCHSSVLTDAAGNPIVTAAGTGPQNGFGAPDLVSAYRIPVADTPGALVAIVDPNDNPNAESELATYRSFYGLPPCTTANGCFTKVNQRGQAGPWPQVGATSLQMEIALDLDMVSAACPSCNLLLVEADSLAMSDGLAADQTAVSLGAQFVSNSWGGPEQSDAAFFSQPGVSFFAAAGDNDYGVQYPASSAFVTAVGGTTLTRSAGDSRGWSEVAWGHPTAGKLTGTGSGCSSAIGKPAWQPPIADCSMRAEVDVSAVASSTSPVAIFALGTWRVVFGTSAASPLVAGIYAATGHGGAGPALSYANPSAFNDVLTGTNGTCGTILCNAGPGWDGPTGNGTPDGSALCPMQIDGVMPSTGPFNASTQVIISGSCLGTISDVLLTKGAATVHPAFTFATGRQLNVTIPPSPDGQAGLATLTLSTPHAFAPFTFSYLSSALSISPASGPTAGGTLVTLSGDGLAISPARVTVTFGGMPAPQAAYCTSATSCTVLTPPSSVGAVDVIVDVNGATQRASNQFVYQGPGITSITPSTGPITGGTYVDLFGSDFDPLMTVSFGGFPSSYVTCVNSEWCTVIAPPVNTAGPVDITVTLPSGITGMTGAADVFTYATLPRLVNVGSYTGATTFVGGATATLFVALDGDAPTGGTHVDLYSSDPATVTVPAYATVPAGQSLISFNAAIVGEDATEDVTVIASYNGIIKNVLIHVVPTPAPRLALSAPSVLATQSVTGTITLAEPAPSGGMVTLSSSDPSAATVTAWVPFNAGGTTGSFVVNALAVAVPTTVTITASYYGVTSSVALTVTPWAPVALRFSSTSLNSQQSITGTVTLGSPAPSGGATVALSSSNLHVSVPSTVKIAAGNTTGNFTLYATYVSTIESATITATYQGSASGTVTIYPPNPPPTTCCAGGCATGRVCGASCTCVLPSVH